MGLREESAEYKLITKEKYHKHDKLFREILNNKKEIVKLINKYITPQAKITDIDFITRVTGLKKEQFMQ